MGIHTEASRVPAVVRPERAVHNAPTRLAPVAGSLESILSDSVTACHGRRKHSGALSSTSNIIIEINIEIDGFKGHIERNVSYTRVGTIVEIKIYFRAASRSRLRKQSSHSITTRNRYAPSAAQHTQRPAKTPSSIFVVLEP